MNPAIKLGLKKAVYPAIKLELKKEKIREITLIFLFFFIKCYIICKEEVGVRVADANTTISIEDARNTLVREIEID